MSGFNLPYLQFHFSESKGSDKSTANFPAILLNYEELPRDMKSNAGSGRSPAAKAKSSQGTRGGIPLTEMVQEGREAQEKENYTTQSQTISVQQLDTEKTCKHRDFPMVQWIRLCASNAGDGSSIPGLGPNITPTAAMPTHSNYWGVHLNWRAQGTHWRSPQAAIQTEPSQKVKTGKTCKQRARYVRVKTSWGQIKHLKLWHRLS